MEDMSPNEEAAYFGAPSLATPERRLRHWLTHQKTHAAIPEDVESLLERADELQAENERLREALSMSERCLTQALGIIVEFGDLNGFRNLSDQELGRTVTQMAETCAHVLDDLRQALEPRHD